MRRGFRGRIVLELVLLGPGGAPHRDKLSRGCSCAGMTAGRGGPAASHPGSGGSRGDGGPGNGHLGATPRMSCSLCSDGNRLVWRVGRWECCDGQVGALRVLNPVHGAGLCQARKGAAAPTPPRCSHGWSVTPFLLASFSPSRASPLSEHGRICGRGQGCGTRQCRSRQGCAWPAGWGSQHWGRRCQLRLVIWSWERRGGCVGRKERALCPGLGCVDTSCSVTLGQAVLLPQFPHPSRCPCSAPAEVGEREGMSDSVILGAVSRGRGMMV